MNTARPKHIPVKEWEYAHERAGRAKRYAEVMPEFVSPLDLRFQDPVWQWEHEIKGRFTNVVGGKLGAVNDSQLKGD